MTSRDELLRLVERLECSAKFLHGEEVDDQASLYMRAAAAIRELLAQKPVAWATPSAIERYAQGNEVVLFPLVAEGDVPLYAAPVPAVDLEAFKAEAMRLTMSLCSSPDTAAWTDRRAALAAHLDKLGGK